MCAIFGSYDVNEAKALQKINASRGALSHSSTVFNDNSEIISIKRGYGELTDFDSSISGYHLYHQQAPTTQASNTIHPAVYNNSLLWHNGIIKDNSLKRIKEVMTLHPSEWDTLQLNMLITNFGFESLKEVYGSFSCVMSFDCCLYMFRNDIAPMFMKGATISSVEFECSVTTIANTVYHLNTESRTWEKAFTFENNETPFFFLD